MQEIFWPSATSSQNLFPKNGKTTYGFSLYRGIREIKSSGSQFTMMLIVAPAYLSFTVESMRRPRSTAITSGILKGKQIKDIGRKEGKGGREAAGEKGKMEGREGGWAGRWKGVRAEGQREEGRKGGREGSPHTLIILILIFKICTSVSSCPRFDSQLSHWVANL